MDELRIEVPVHDDPDWMSNSPFSPGKDRLESYEGKLKKTGSYYRLAEREAEERRSTCLREVRERAARENRRLEESRARREQLTSQLKEAVAQHVEAKMTTVRARLAEQREEKALQAERRSARRRGAHERRMKVDMARADKAMTAKARVNAAASKRARLVQATVDHAAHQVKHSIAVATALKEAQREAAAAAAALLEKKLDAAASRREENRKRSYAELPPSPASPTSPPAACDAPSAPAEPSGAEAAAGTEGSLAERLLAQLRAQRQDASFGKISRWMQKRETLELVGAWLETTGVQSRHARSVLCLVCMDIDKDQVFSEAPADAVMEKEAGIFTRRLFRRLKADIKAEAEGNPPADPKAFGASLLRAKRFQIAWSADDKPRTLAFLMDSLMAQKMKAQKAAGEGEGERNAAAAEAAEAEAEEIIEQIRRLGGAEAEAEARARYAGTYQTVAAADIAQRVGEVAKRAFWDVLRSEVVEGKLDGLWSLLNELHKAMCALISHNVRATEELNDKFDPKWLKQQAEAGVLEVASVRELVGYVARTIRGWQAPADDAEAAEWCDGVMQMLMRAEEEKMRLDEFIAHCLIDFLGGALDRVGQVYERMLAYADERKKEREEAEAAAASDAGDAGPSGSSSSA